MTTSAPAPRRRNPLPLIIIGIVLLALIAYIVVARIAYDTMSLRGTRTPREVLAPQMAYQDVSFPSRGRDYPVYAFWQTTTPDAPVIINVHGYGGSRYQPFIQNRAQILVDLGYNVLSLDLSDNGGQTIEDGRISMGFDERYDVLGAYDYLISQGYAPEKIGLVGESMGAATSLMAAELQPSIKIIWADSPFRDAPEVLREQAGVLGFPSFIVSGSLVWAQVMSNDDIAQASPMTDAANLAENDQSVYLITCVEDQVVNPHHGHDLYAQFQELGIDVQFWELGCTDHATGILFAPEEYVARLGAFLGNHFGMALPEAEATAEPRAEATPEATVEATPDA
jgi:dipeptidyl aminopeptidase/acylaminoacyl peptidase